MPTCLNCGTLKYVADHTERPGYMYERVPAPRVPRDLIRHRLPVVEAGVMRAGGLSEHACILAGMTMDVQPGRLLPNPHEQFERSFNRRWGRKVRFEDNPWLWWTRVGEGGGDDNLR